MTRFSAPPLQMERTDQTSRIARSTGSISLAIGELKGWIIAACLATIVGQAVVSGSLIYGIVHAERFKSGARDSFKELDRIQRRLR
jgi:hypothetical protein